MSESENYGQPQPDQSLDRLRASARYPLVAVETEERHREPWWLMLIALLFAISAALLLIFYVELDVFLH